MAAGGTLKSTQEKMERRKTCDNKVAFYEERKKEALEEVPGTEEKGMLTECMEALEESAETADELNERLLKESAEELGEPLPKENAEELGEPLPNGSAEESFLHHKSIDYYA